jgi:hypothetical protein
MSAPADKVSMAAKNLDCDMTPFPFATDAKVALQDGSAFTLPFAAASSLSYAGAEKA